MKRLKLILKGKVERGIGNASHWLKLYNKDYVLKIGMPVFPGSLNLALDEPFDWMLPKIQSKVIWFGREEYGGERDIMLLPCKLKSLKNLKAFLWSTTTAVGEPGRQFVVEIIAAVGLRVTFGLKDGDMVEVEIVE